MPERPPTAAPRRLYARPAPPADRPALGELLPEPGGPDLGEPGQECESQGGGAFAHVRRRLVDDFNISAIVRLPLGAFPFAPDTRTNLVFFTKKPNQGTIRYYQVKPPVGKRAFTKTRPVTDQALAGALAWVRDGVRDANSWEVAIDEIRGGGYDLDLVPPEVSEQLDPKVISARIESFSGQTNRLGALIEPLLEAAHRAEQYRLDRVVRTFRLFVGQGVGQAARG